MFGFGDLPKVVFGEYERVLLLSGVERSIANVEQVGAKWKMRAVLLENAEGKKTDSSGAVNAFSEIGSREFLPVDRKLRRCSLSMGLWQTQRQTRQYDHRDEQVTAGMDA